MFDSSDKEQSKELCSSLAKPWKSSKKINDPITEKTSRKWSYSVKEGNENNFKRKGQRRTKKNIKDDIQINNDPEFTMEYDSNITQNYRSTEVIDPSKISSITSQQESYWSMHDSQSRAEYLLVGPDGFKMTDELWVKSVDFDKRTEYLKNLINKINSADKYIWKFLDNSHKRVGSFDKLEIIKKSCTNQLHLDHDLDLITDYSLNNE